MIHGQVGYETRTPTFSVGIDLGTTHCALSSAPLGSDANPQVIGIPQVVNPGQTVTDELLPSFLYIPSAHEFADGALGLPWSDSNGFAVGRFAREHGAKVPDRLVSSAKSWLCHDGVDRNAGLLPFGAGPEVEKISPRDSVNHINTHLSE